MSKTKSFLPDDYEIPKAGGGYTKIIKNGEIRIRILSEPCIYWKVWLGGKVTNVKYEGKDSKPDKGPGEKDSVSHVWAVIVYNKTTGKIEVFEIEKQTLQSDIQKLYKDKDWGHPSGYDLKVAHTGSNRNDTKYSAVPAPKTAIDDEIMDAFDACPINLDLLLENKDPFLGNPGDEASTAGAKTNTKNVTPENWVEGDAVPAGYKIEKGKCVKRKIPFAQE